MLLLFYTGAKLLCLMAEHRICVFQKRIFIKMFGIKRMLTRDREKLYNEKLHNEDDLEAPSSAINK
jgi:hypothetical protein